MTIRYVMMLFVAGALSLGGCAAQEYDSACHELMETASGQLRSMNKSARKAHFERHVVLLETGSGMTSACRSYFIDADAYRNLPESMVSRCDAQGASGGERYCLIYYVDGERWHSEVPLTDSRQSLSAGNP